MTVRAGREFLAIPGPTTMPDEVLRAMHRPALDIYSDQMIELTDSLLRDLSQAVRHQGPLLHLHRQRPRRLGSRALQRAVARRQDPGAGKRPVRDRLGQRRGGDGRRGRGAEGRLAPRDPPRRGRSAAARRTRITRIKAILAVQVDTASGAYQRHRGDRQGDQGGRPSGAVHGRCGGLARLHAVRDGRLGHRCRDVRLAEGPDDAAGPRLRRRQRPRPRGAQEGRICARPIGTGPSAKAPSITANMPAPRRCICCSRCARRSTCCSRRSSKTCSCAIACWPKRCAARSRSGPRARCSASTSPNPASGPTRSPPW